MKTPLQVIADFGCPTNSMIEAMRHLGEREDLTFDQYKKGIQDIVGMEEPPPVESYHFAQVMFKYVVQETIRAYNTGIIPNMDQIFVICVNKTMKFIEENPWSVTMFNINHGLQKREEIDPETGAIVSSKPKGDKKEITERIFKDLKSKGATRQDIINAFVQETGMSIPGATTYFHSLKKEFGFKEAEVQKKPDKLESKQELAERLYQESDDKSKPTMIALFTEKLGTSKLGAQTYYYACKKKFTNGESTTDAT